MGRLKRLDGIRGLLAIYVMLGHAIPLAIVPRWAASLFSHGGAAVNLFFAISGLVIAFSLERFNHNFAPFIAARARRLFPAYFIVLAASIALLTLGDPLPHLPWAAPQARDIVEATLPLQFWPHLAAHLLLLHGLIPQNILPYAYVTLLGPAWSLSTEWQFYLLIGLIAPRRLAPFALAMLALAIAWQLLPFQQNFSRAFLPQAAAYLALGLATAAALKGEGWRSLALCALAAIILGALQNTEKALTPLAWLLILLAQRQNWGQLLESRALRYLGALSYPVYLLNEPVQRALALLLAPAAHGNAIVFSSLFLPLSLLLTLAAAALLHHSVEKPCLNYNKKLLLPVIAPALRQ